MKNAIRLREIVEDDLRIFFEQERDPVANLLAAYPAKDETSFLSHWRNRVLGNPEVFKRTILFNECVAGNIECWEQDGKWLLGYWIGKEFWGKGIATAALREFLTHLKIRPLNAYVAKHNEASIRVLKKCGFRVSGQGTFFSKVHGQDIEELYFIRY